MSNDRDQEIVKSALSDTGSGLLEFLGALGQREALAFGDGIALPVRIKFDELPADVRPRSSTANFSAHWQRSVGDEEFLEQLVEKWRSSAVSAHGHAAQEDAVVAEAKTVRSEPAPPTGVIATGAAAPVRTASTLRKDVPLTGTKSNAASIRRGTEQPTHMAAGNGSTDQPVPGEALKSLRERLMQRNQR